MSSPHDTHDTPPDHDTGGSLPESVQFDTNVDDLDPRLWPHVLDALLAAGAQDAWLTPIIMKKGRPAHTLSALCDPSDADSVLDGIFRETSTIGVRRSTVQRHVLDRRTRHVSVDGERIGVKIAFDDDGDEANRSVEWDDVVAAAAALEMSAKDVLAAATAAAHRQRQPQQRESE